MGLYRDTGKENEYYRLCRDDGKEMENTKMRICRVLGVGLRI